MLIEYLSESMEEESVEVMQVDRHRESVAFVAANEFKHKSALLTVTDAEKIALTTLNDKRV